MANKKNKEIKNNHVNNSRIPELTKRLYERELKRISFDLVQMQHTVKQRGLKVVMIFEGRDAAGKGGAIKAISGPLNPRGSRVVALPAPSDRE